MRARLTERQNQAYEFILQYHRRQGKPPTLREIGQALGIRSSNGVYKLLRALEKKGYILRRPHEPRSIEIPELSGSTLLEEEAPALILVGRASSLAPDRLRSRPRGVVHVDPRLLQGADPERCLVCMQGDDGMRPEGLWKGDLLVVEEIPREALASRELVVALLRERMVARRYEFINGKIHLRPADRTYTEEVYPPDHPECYIVGRVLSVMRVFSVPGAT